jgi:putative two-component system response regulator
MPPEALADLERGGYLHDIGKITVPDAILNKAGKLTTAERDLVRAHPEAGERICNGLRSLRSVLPLIRHHHERLDGSGYPDGIQGDQIPVTVRVLQVVDVYDALTTQRPYRRALPPPDALHILHEEVDQGWWDPAIVAGLESMLEHDEPRTDRDA